MLKSKFSVFIIAMIVSIHVNSQISNLSNTGGSAGQYVGWAVGNTLPLEIRHNATGQPITFFTSNGTPTERMRLTPTGELGLGTTTPASFMHLNTTATGNLFRTNGPNNVLNQWQLFTNSQKFRVFVPANSNEANLEAVQAAGYLNLNTAGGTNTAYPNIKLRVFPDDIDRMVAFESPFISNATTFIPAYNAKFIINDRNNTSSLSSLVDDALLLRVQGIGKILPGLPAALPIGSGEGYGNFTMAEIISTRRNVGDAGLRLQGSRTACQKCDIGFIDFANFDEVPGGSNVLFNMSRIASGSQDKDSSRGYIRFYTNDGSGNPFSANDSGLLERMRINGYGNGFFNIRPINGASNLMSNTARFNILDNDRPQLRLVNFVNGVNIARIYTNLQTTDIGDLFIQPLDETLPEDSLYARFVGIHTSKPLNTLDINSTKASPRWNELTTHGTSGLRFSNLSALNKPMVNPGKGVLAVDSNGNVVYVKAQNALATCDDSLNGFLEDYSKLDLNNFNFYFTKNDLLGSNHVGIGYDCEAILPAKLSVLQIHPLVVNASTISISGINKDISNIAGTVYTGVEGIAGGLQTISKVVNRGGYFSASNATDIRGLVVELPSSTVNTASAIGGEYIVTSTATDNIGVFAQSSGVTTTGTNLGVHGRATNSDKFNIGGNFSALTTSSNGISTGVVGSGEGSNIFNAGGFFSVTTNNNAANMAVYARGGVPTASLYPAAVAIGVYSNSNVSNNGLPGYAGYFDGNVLMVQQVVVALPLFLQMKI